MQQLTSTEMKDVTGGDFWTGVQCGFGIVALTVAPEISPLLVGGVIIVCGKAFSS